jgi:L-iditol 2-dehydrogenase
VRLARLYGVRDVRLDEEPAPVAAAGSSLVRVTAVGLCGSDLHWYAEAGIGDAVLGRPLVLGHEFAGVISGGPRDGERVAVDPAMPCEHCATCRTGHRNLCPTVRFAGHGDVDGALREYLTWPTRLLVPLPSELSDVDGALLEPLGVALHAVGLAKLRPGLTVAVLGCGPIGLLLIQLARAAGAAAVLATDPLAHRRAAAERAGADVVRDPAGPMAAIGAAAAELARVALGPAAAPGVDVAFEVAGTDDAVHAAMVAARPGGKVLLVGIPDGDTTTFPASVARRKGLTVLLSRRMDDTYPRAIRLVRRGAVDLAGLVSACYPLAETDAAFTAAASRDGLKIVVQPSGA